MAKEISMVLTKELRALNIGASERVFIDLWKRCEYDKMDAWALAGMWLRGANDVEQRRAVETVLAKPSVSAYMKEVVAVMRAQQSKGEVKRVKSVRGEEDDMSDDEIQMMLSKDYQLKECLRALKHCEVGTKEWLDIKKMIADITQVKKEQSGVEDKLVHVYLPLRCGDCEYRRVMLERGGKGKGVSDEE